MYLVLVLFVDGAINARLEERCGFQAIKGLIGGGRQITQHCVDVDMFILLQGSSPPFMSTSSSFLRARDSREEIVRKLNELMDSAKSFLVPADFDYLRRGGRLSPLVSHVGKAAGLTPIMTQTDTGERLTIAAIRRGYNHAVNTLRLWDAKSPKPLDMQLFRQGQYLQASEERAMADVISKVLYPEDNHYEGKSLRLKQQYFFVSATVQSITRRHIQVYGTLKNFHEKNVIQINDTHPALVVPELMRILIDDARTDGSVFEGVEGYGTIHCAGVDKDIAQALSDALGEGALSTRREAIEGNNDFFS